MNSKIELDSIHVIIEESILFEVSEKQLTQFEVIIDEHQIAHHSLFLEPLTSTTYLFYPSKKIVLRPLNQVVDKYCQLGLPILPFEKWLEDYVL